MQSHEPLVKRSLKEELLKPRYRDAFGPVVNAVLLEQGLAAQLCNSLFAQEERLARAGRRGAADDGGGGLSPAQSAGSTGHMATSARALASPLPEPELKEELSVVSAIRDKWAAQLHTTLMHHCEETGQPLMRVAAETSRSRQGRGCRWLFSADDVLVLL